MYWCQHSVTTNADKVSVFIFHINNHAHSVNENPECTGEV